jgi:outer membrane protein OmpA-like peptidoglycan-associated protein
MLLPALTACGQQASPGEPGAIALVVGGRSNMPKPQLVRRAQELVDDAVKRKSTLFIVSVSGHPEILYSEEVQHDCDSRAACQSVVNDYRRRVGTLLGRVKAKTAEADTLGAILVAARALAGVRKPGPRRIVVVDSGLQTAGDMPLQAPGALSVDLAQLVEPWVKEDRLKSLTAVEVLLTGIGAAHAPQQPVPQNAVVRLEELWRAVLRAGKAIVDVDPSPLADVAPVDGLPAVTPVPFDDKVPALPGGCFKIREDQIGFLPGRAEFRDPGKAKQILTPIANELTSRKLTATVIGTTALPENPPFDLSNRRSRAVVEALVGLGVPRTSLTSGGVGNRFAGFVPDTDPSGRLIETLAVQNRLVIIQPVGQACP